MDITQSDCSHRLDRRVGPCCAGGRTGLGSGIDKRLHRNSQASHGQWGRRDRTNRRGDRCAGSDSVRWWRRERATRGDRGLGARADRLSDGWAGGGYCRWRYRHWQWVGRGHRGNSRRISRHDHGRPRSRPLAPHRLTLSCNDRPRITSIVYLRYGTLPRTHETDCGLEPRCADRTPFRHIAGRDWRTANVEPAGEFRHVSTLAPVSWTRLKPGLRQSQPSRHVVQD